MNHVTATDKTKLYVKDWGSGRPVILIHGWPLSADSWDDQHGLFATHKRRLTKDLIDFLGR